MVRAHLQEAAIILARLANEDRLDRCLHVVVDAAPADTAIEHERLIVRVKHQLLGLAEVGAHERHPAVRELHVRRLDGQRQTLKCDRLMAPVELVRLAGRKAQRYERLCRNPCPFVPPRSREPVHAVVGAVIAATTQLFEQPLGRPPFPPGQFGFFLQNPGQNLDPLAQFWRRLNATLIPELGRPPADHLAHRRARNRQRPHNLFDRQMPLEKSASYLSDLVHADHPHKPLPANTGQQKGTLTKRQRGSRLDAKNTPQGVIIASEFTDRRQGLLDDMVQAHDSHMTGLMRRARHAAEAEARRLRRAAEDGLVTLLDTGKAVLAGDQEESVAGLRDRLGVDRLHGAVTACEAVSTQESRGVVDAVLARYPDLRKSLPHFLSLPFTSDIGQEPLLRAIDLIRRLDRGEIKTLPEDAPTDFVPAGWQKVLRDDRGRLYRSVWETALALAIRDALRSGDLHLPDSRRYAGFWSLVFDEPLWATARTTAYADLGLSERPAEQLAKLAHEIEHAAIAFANGLAANDFAGIDQGQLRLHRPDALPVSPELHRLRREIESRMPRVRIEDILLDIDQRCGFTRAFRPLT